MISPRKMGNLVQQDQAELLGLEYVDQAFGQDDGGAKKAQAHWHRGVRRLDDRHRRQLERGKHFGRQPSQPAVGTRCQRLPKLVEDSPGGQKNHGVGQRADDPHHGQRREQSPPNAEPGRRDIGRCTTGDCTAGYCAARDYVAGRSDWARAKFGAGRRSTAGDTSSPAGLCEASGGDPPRGWRSTWGASSQAQWDVTPDSRTAGESVTAMIDHSSTVCSAAADCRRRSQAADRPAAKTSDAASARLASRINTSQAAN